MTMTHVPLTQPLHSALERDVAMRLAATEYGRLVELLRSLRADDWTKPTDCTGWDVRAVAAHALGMAVMVTSPQEQQRQFQAAGDRLQERGGLFIDALTGIQVDERDDMTPAQIVDEFAACIESAVVGRTNTPQEVLNQQRPNATQVGDHSEFWTFGYLIDVILTRDPWMHRIDIVRATGARHTMTAEHDGAIVADVVAEWAARHCQPVTVHLTGPAGGEWSFGTGGPTLDYDAADFCAALSGRGPTEGLLSIHVPF